MPVVRRRIMRRISFPPFFTMIAVLLVCATADSRAQSKPETKKDEAPLRVVLAGLVHGHASGFFDQFQHRADLRVVGIADPDRQLPHSLQSAIAWRPVSSFPIWKRC